MGSAGSIGWAVRMVMITPQSLLGASKDRCVSGRLSPLFPPTSSCRAEATLASRDRVGPWLIGRPFPPGMCILLQKVQKLPTVSWGRKEEAGEAQLTITTLKWVFLGLSSSQGG